jgi:hypothetical protein
MQVDTDPDGVFEGEVGEEIIPLQSPPKGAFSSIRHISPNTADFQDFVQNLRCNPGIVSARYAAAQVNSTRLL